MRRIKPEELPKKLTEDDVTILAVMSDEIPQSKEWHEIFEILTPEDYRKIMDRKIAIQRQKAAKHKSEMTDQEIQAEKSKWEKIKNDPDPNEFYGNMGQPVTPREYKDRYGVWPPGYDQSTGEKLSKD